MVARRQPGQVRLVQLQEVRQVEGHEGDRPTGGQNRFGGGGVAMEVELGTVLDVALAPDGAAHDDDPLDLLEEAGVAVVQFGEVGERADADDDQFAREPLDGSAVGLGVGHGFEGFQRGPVRLAQAVLAEDVAGVGEGVAVLIEAYADQGPGVDPQGAEETAYVAGCLEQRDVAAHGDEGLDRELLAQQGQRDGDGVIDAHVGIDQDGQRHIGTAPVPAGKLTLHRGAASLPPPIIGVQNPMVNVPDSLIDTFATRFGQAPEVIVRSPGRVNLIGEHTDYNEGFVMPVATEQGFWVIAGRRDDGLLAVRSEDLDQAGEWDLAQPVPPHKGLWSSYVRGVAAVLRAGGYPIGGTNLLISGDLPVGSGLSSSAALEVGTAMALLTANDAGAQVGERVNLAHLCRKAEHEYAGVPCGIMDQYACLMGQEDRAILLDCRSVSHALIPIPADWRIVILDTQVKHSLASGEYARRQKDCRRAVEQAATVLGRELKSLRDLDEATLEAVAGRLEAVAGRRARHVVTENARVVAAGEAFRQGDGVRAGQLMYASHASLRDDYEVSCKELDLLVEIASQVEGVYGARMTGGGFGGCAVAITTVDGAERLQAAVIRLYNTVQPKPARIILTGASDGAKVWRIG